MKEVAFTLETGKEIPARLNGTVVRYTLPTTPEECLAVCGGNSEVLVSVFNEGFNLNHRQKIAKRFASREASTIETIQAGLDAHKPGIRTATEGTRSAVKSARSQVMDEMLAKLSPEDQAAFKQRLEAIKPVRKPKAEGETAGATEAAPVAAEASNENKAQRRAK